MSKDPIAHKQMWFLNSPHVPGYGILRSETGLQPFTPFVTWCHVLCFAMRSGRSARRPIFGLATGDNGDSRCRSSMRRSSGTGNPSNNMNSTWMHHDEHHEESKKRKKPTVSPHRRIGETFYSPGASSHSSSGCTRRSICKPSKKLEGLDPLNFWNSLDSLGPFSKNTNSKQIPSLRPPFGGFSDSPTYHVGLDLDPFWCYGKYLPWDSVISPLKPKKSSNPKSPSSNHQLWIYQWYMKQKGNHSFWLKSCSNIQEMLQFLGKNSAISWWARLIQMRWELRD